jgi:hypothetical protein
VRTERTPATGTSWTSYSSSDAATEGILATTDLPGTSHTTAAGTLAIAGVLSTEEKPATAAVTLHVKVHLYRKVTWIIGK